MNRFWTPGWNSDQALNKFQAEVGGQLVGGDPGVRLFEPAAGGNAEPGSFYPATVSGVQPAAGEVLVVGRAHVFGSEELSARAPGVASRAPRPYVAVSRADLEKREVKEGALAKLVAAGAGAAGGGAVELPVMAADLPAGVVQVPAFVQGSPSKGWSFAARLEIGGAR